MFALKKRIIGGFTFKQLYPKSFGSLAGHPHLGVDYRAAVGDKLYAPFNGTVKTLYGQEGGNTIWFYPEGQDVIIRFMHLSAFKVGTGQKVKEGDLIALTGNTGSATNAPHLHLDISKKKVDIYNINNFIDPERFCWISDPIVVNKPKIDPVTPIKEKVKQVTIETVKDASSAKIEATAPVIDKPREVQTPPEDLTTPFTSNRNKPEPTLTYYDYSKDLKELEDKLTPWYEKAFNFIIKLLKK